MALNVSLGKLSIKIGADTEGLKKGRKKSQSELKKIDKSLKKNAKTWESWNVKAAAATAAVGLAVVAVTGKLKGYSDAFTSITNKLKIATDSTEDLNFVTEQLFKTSNETRTSVESTVDLYAKLERSTRNLDIPQSRLLKVTESINKAFAISGATTQETTGSIRQLGQALASGALRGDEFNSIAEQAPIIMEAVKEATGKTAGELRELAAEGVITAEVLIESLERYADKIDTDFAQATATFSQKLEVAKNNAIAFTGANDAINDAVGTAGDGVVLLSENLETVGKVATAVAAVIGARMVGALSAATVAQVKLVLAQTTATTTTTVYSAAVMRMVTTTTRATAAMRASRFAALALKGSLALIGGPAGAATLAAIALVTFASAESEAEQQTEETTRRVDEQIKSLQNLGKTQRQLAEKDLAAVAAKSKELEEQIDKLQQRQVQATQSTREFGSGFSALGGRISAARDELEELTKQKTKLQELVGALQGVEEVEKKGAQDKIDLDEAEKRKKEAAAAKRRQEREKKIEEELAKQRAAETARFLEDLDNRILSAEERENKAFAADLERLRNTFADKSDLTAQELEREQGLFAEHEQALADIRGPAAASTFEMETVGLLEAMGLRFESQNEMQLEQFEREKEMLDAQLAAKELSQDEHSKRMTEIRRREEEVKRQITVNGLQAGFKALSQNSKKIEKVMKAAAIAQALIKGKQAAVDAWQAGMSVGGPWAPLVAAAYTAASIASTASLIGAIKSGGSGSGGGGGASVSPSRGGAAGGTSPGSPAGQPGQQQPRNIEVRFTGQGLLNTDQVRELMEQINEQIGDGVELGVAGG